MMVSSDSEEDGPSPARRQRMSSPVNKYRLTMDSTTQLEDVLYAGRIVRIEMQNILCHSNQEIRFNPRINFISGSNGSGKSAILASLVVGLGEQCSVTGRFKSVKDMIKLGESSGKITIELMNDGCNAYKPEEYGDRITVVRSMARSGASSYMIKSADGTVISKKKKDLDNICRSLHLTVSNPLCILNQDYARTFLSSVDSRLRYRFFMMATGLDEIETNLAQNLARLRANHEDIKKHEKGMKEQGRILQESKKKVEAVREVQTTKEELEKLSNELAWIQVIAEEVAIESLKKEKDTMMAKIEKSKSDMKNYKKLMDDFDAKRVELRKELERVMTSRSEIDNEKNRVHRDVLILRKELAQLNPSLDLLRSRIARIDEQLEGITENMKTMDELNQLESDKASERRARLEELKNLIKTALSQKANADDTLAGILATNREMKAKIQEIESELNANKNIKARKQRHVEGLRGQDVENLSMYGDYVPRLLQEIKANLAKFHKEPVGPLGRYVKLNGDSKWAAAVESVVKGLMKTFCCTDDHDFKLLLSLAQKVSSRVPTIIISKFFPNKHDVSRKIVRDRNHPEIRTIYDLLSFSNVVAHNTMIDQAAIESIMLFESDAQAATICTRIEDVPKGLSYGVLPKCDKYYPAPRYRTYGGAPSTYFFNQGLDKKELVAKLMSEIKGIEAELESGKEQRDAMLARCNANTEFHAKTTRTYKNLLREIDIHTREMKELEDAELNMQVPLTRVALEEEIEALMDKKKAIKAELDAKLNSSSSSREKLEEKETELKGLCVRLDEIKAELSACEEEIRANDEEKRSQEMLKNTSEAQTERFTRRLVDHGEVLARHQVERERLLAEAETLHKERIESRRSPAEVYKLIDEKEKRVRAMGKLLGDQVDILQKYAAQLKSFDKITSAIGQCKNFSDFFQMEFELRKKSFNEARSFRAQEVSTFFSVALKTRGFDGLLKFNFDDGVLDLEVQPQKNSKVKRENVTTLSGGEKSFSTVSLIQAIWRSTILPFAAMDEFDVFMDEANRKLVMDLLVQYAEESPTKQFIFLSPLDVSSIKQNEHCTVFRLQDHHKRPGDCR